MIIRVLDDAVLLVAVGRTVGSVAVITDPDDIGAGAISRTVGGQQPATAHKG